MESTVRCWEDGAETALKMLKEMADEGVFSLDVAMDIFMDATAHLGHWVRLGAPQDAVDSMVIPIISDVGMTAMRYFADKDGTPDLGWMHHILCGKQRDYGHGNILNFGIAGVCIRLCDKFARLNNLLSRDNHGAVNESITDTWLDIVGYSTIGIMLRNGWFQLNLQGEETWI